MALALYRRYRPDTFDGLIGQEQVTIPLSHALDEGKIIHAYLFSGPRGCGKTSSARILARCINCVKGPTSHPCGECQSCKDLATGGPGSIDVVEIDAASHNGVDDARELRERASFAPARDRYKIFILDEAHMVTPQGFNALLKIVEEPPEHIVFIFATTEPEKVIGTIRSRTHHYPFRLVPEEVMQPYLEDICHKEHIELEAGVLRLAMRAGGGSMRDTLSVLDQLMMCAENGVIGLSSAVALLGFTPHELIGDLIDALIDDDGSRAYDVVQRVVVGGFDARKFVEDLLVSLRDLILMVSAGKEAASRLLTGLAPEEIQALVEQSQRLHLPELVRIVEAVNQTLIGMSNAISPRMSLEILVARLLSERTESTTPTPTRSTPDRVPAQKTDQGHFIGSQDVQRRPVERSQVTVDSTSAAPVSAAASAPTASSMPSTASTNVSVNNVDALWDTVLQKLPHDVREYVTRDYVPRVQLVQVPGRSRLILTFDQPLSQHAFALAVCTTTPYEGEKVPKVVMSVVRTVFDEHTMIAPAPVAANGEHVEAVKHMSQEQLTQIKHAILVRKLGNATDSTDTNPAKPADDVNFHKADGSAASVTLHNAAVDTVLPHAVALQSSDDDAWASMSSMSMEHIATMPDARGSQKQDTTPASMPAPEQSHVRPSVADALDPKVQAERDREHDRSIAVRSVAGAQEDECSLDDQSLGTSLVSVDELKTMFAVKATQDFAANDPKNPKNMSNHKNRS